LTVKVHASGAGPLSGMLLLLPLGESVDFHSSEVRENATFQQDFVIPSGRLPPGESGRMKVTLVTDSYLVNRRVLETEIPYRAVYLKKSPPALIFGSVPPGAAHTLRLVAQRSDGKELDLRAAIPRHAAAYLTATRIETDTYAFRLDASRLQPGTPVIEDIALTDGTSGLRDKIKVIAEVMGT
jgi:hypothetical protein